MDKKIKINFYDFSPQDLELIFSEKGFERYRVRQISNWVYGKDVLNAEKMKNLPADIKDELTNCYAFNLPDCTEVLESEDGSSKFIFTAPDGVQFESVLIPDGKKLTLCISTQAGCRMKCDFCFTGKGGLRRSLEVHEITGQYIAARRRCENLITNIVYMGMGEPFDNMKKLKKSVEILGKHIVSDDYEFKEFPFGHLSILASSKAKETIWKECVSWLKERSCNFSEKRQCEQAAVTR